MVSRLARGLLRLCLLAWPARRRRRHGAVLVATSLRLVSEAAGRGPGPALHALAGEALALLWEGLRFRWAELRDSLSVGTTGLLLDLRFATRGLIGRPGFTAVAVLTLALGIGGNAAIFSLVDGLLLQPPPYERPDELVLVWNDLPSSDERVPVAGPDAAVLAERSGLLTDVAFTIRGTDGALELGAGQAARHVRVAAVTRNFFRTLGVTPVLGRSFDAEAAPGSTPPTALLSHQVWRTTFAGDPSAVGRDVRMNGRLLTVSGVLPPGFTLALPPDAGVLTDVDIWIPLAVPLTAFRRQDDRLLDQDSDNTGAVVARLAAGATLDQARTEAAQVAADLRREVPGYAQAGLGFQVNPLLDDATAHARPVLLLLLAGAVAVLLVATVNLATLLLARGAARSAEFSVRGALGAGRGRILRQLLVESALLVGLGLAMGLLLGWGAMEVARAWVPTTLTPPGGVSLDLRGLAFAGSLAGLVALFCGLAPGLAMGRAGTALPGGDLDGPPEGGARRGLVVAEIAFSMALVLGAGLLLRTVGALEDTHPGFEEEGALTFKVSLRTPEAYRSPADRAHLMQDIEAHLEALPGVEAVGLVGVLPLERRRWTQPYGLPGQPRSEWRSNRADFRTVSSGAFQALGTRILEGRGFTPREDVVESERVVVVDRRLAERIAPGGSALDAVIGIPLDGAPVEARVVGVVESVRYERLDAQVRPAVYVPYRQEASREVSFVVRGRDPTTLTPAVQDAVHSVDSRVPVYHVRTLSEYVRSALAPRHFALTLLTAFALLALLCVSIGLYGVIAFDVGSRRRSIGVRMAVGATRRDVVGAVLAPGLRLAALGILLGVPLAAGVGEALRSLAFGVSATDPLLWTAVVGLVLAVTFLACWVPAIRASRLDPTQALRAD